MPILRKHNGLCLFNNSTYSVRSEHFEMTRLVHLQMNSRNLEHMEKLVIINFNTLTVTLRIHLCSTDVVPMHKSSDLLSVFF